MPTIIDHGFMFQTAGGDWVRDTYIRCSDATEKARHNARHWCLVAARRESYDHGEPRPVVVMTKEG